MKSSKKEIRRFPIPVRIHGTDEIGPCPQTREQKQVEARLTGLSGVLAEQHGITRREFQKWSNTA